MVGRCQKRSIRAGLEIEMGTTQLLICAVLIGTVVLRVILFYNWKKTLQERVWEESAKKKRETLRNRIGLYKIAFIVSEILVFGVAAVLAAWHQLWIALIVAILVIFWEKLSYVVTDVAHFNLRIGPMGRVSGDHAACKEGIESKWPWEKVRTYEQLVGNHQGSVTLVCGTALRGTQKDSKGRPVEGGREADSEFSEDGSHLGGIKIDFTAQDRVSTTARDASGRARAPEISDELIKNGLKDRIEALLVSVAAFNSIDSCLGAKESFEIMARCALELQAMPHEDAEFLRELAKKVKGKEKRARYRKYAKEASSGGVPERERLNFYRENKQLIISRRLEDPETRSRDSWYERTYGRDVVAFFLPRVLPADKKLLEALDVGRITKAIDDAVAARIKDDHSRKEAERFVLAALGIADYQLLDISGQAAIPLVPVGSSAGRGG